MPDLTNLSAKISNYKCFADTPQGFDSLLPINIIIGRNNAGKSTLLELIQRATQNNVTFAESDRHKQAEPTIILEHPLAEDELRNVFREGQGSSDLRGDSWQFGKRWIGKCLRWRLAKNQDDQVFISIAPPLDTVDHREQWESNIARKKRNPLSEVLFRRLAAERNISPEEADIDELNIGVNGQNATRLLNAYLHRASLPRHLAKSDILRDLNEICSPDSVFSEILTRQHEDKRKWEIYLSEEGKGLIALSNTGSGFKTILLVLILVHLVPHHDQKELSQYVFALEELENNLHPAILRRLLLYLRNTTANTHCVFLLTTHSNIVIDLFSKDENAQIIHVTHDKVNASAKRVTTYIENKGILDDLDVRASDLLQANGIIWVEGPSDRVYLNKWIALWTDNKLQEGTHYQCVFYGGKLLAHLAAEPQGDDTAGPINILRVNVNAVVLIDSDKSDEPDKINATKERIRSEIESIGGLSWVTKGRAIENYIPPRILEQLHPGKTFAPVKQFTKFDEYLDGVQEGLGEKFKRSKVIFAENTCKLFEKQDINNLDLTDRLAQIVAKIQGWNRLGELTDI